MRAMCLCVCVCGGGWVCVGVVCVCVGVGVCVCGLILYCARPVVAAGAVDPAALSKHERAAGLYGRK